MTNVRRIRRPKKASVLKYRELPGDPKPQREGMVVPGTSLPRELVPTSLTHWSNHLDTCDHCNLAFPAGGDLCGNGAELYAVRLEEFPMRRDGR